MKLSVAYQGEPATTFSAIAIESSPINRRTEAGPTRDDAGRVIRRIGGELWGYFVGQFCARHDISREGLKVDAEWTMAEGPPSCRADSVGDSSSTPCHA